MANVNSTNFIFAFAAISCIICSALLSGASVSLKPLQDANIKLDQQKSVLVAAALVKETAAPEEISSWFAKDENGNAAVVALVIDQKSGQPVDSPSVDDFLKKPDSYKGKAVVYECRKAGSECFILPVVGKGLWGPMKGYLAINKDVNTILGISFYDHKETPGLGAEITEPWFKDQFKNKKLLNQMGAFSKENFSGVRVLKGYKVADKPESDQPHYVDGISGATITSIGVTEIMTQFILDNYLTYLSGKSS